MSAVYPRKSPNFAVDRIRHFWLLAFFLLFALIPCRLRAEESPAQVYFYHALKSKQEGQILTAERLLKKAIDLEPENPDFHFELGNLYIEHNNPVSARMELEQVIMISPRYLAAHYNLGLVYRELGFMGEARDEFQKVLELDPTHVKAQLQIGYTYQEEGFFEDARFAFQRAREMDITDPEPVRALEDLADFERGARERSASAMERSFQNLPASESPSGFLGATSQPQASNRDVLLQTGMTLLQEFLARRAQNKSENTSGTQSS